MRSVEALHYTISIGYFVLYFTKEYERYHTHAFSGVLLMFPIGHYIEGIRMI